MALDWRDTLQTLKPQFESLAARSKGLYHLLVEVADHERENLAGPPWFASWQTRLPGARSKLAFETWDMFAMRGLPGVSPSFRELQSDETIDDIDPARLIRDKSGKPRAVAVPMKLRNGYFCGPNADGLVSFEALANVAAAALTQANDLADHALASDLLDIFRRPRGGIRYVFGEVPTEPQQFIAQGWDAGILQYEHGVLIDVPISERDPDSCHWLLFLHRLGWRQDSQAGLSAKRWAWNGSTEVDFESISRDWRSDPTGFSKLLIGVSKDSFYSTLGSKETPTDVNLASALAIQLLLASTATVKKSMPRDTEVTVDYSQEEWFQQSVPSMVSVARDDCDNLVRPRIGVLCATEAEREAILKRLRPPRGKRTLLTIFDEHNTCFRGRLGETEVVVCMAAMGSSGRDGSTVVATEVIRSWQLRAVIMIGIAFGRDPSKQRIGTVLVSERIAPYEPQRIGEATSVARGGETAAGRTLLNRFRNTIGWEFYAPDGTKCDVQFGVLLSGEKLVDNLDFKTALFDRHPTAIGGEMEGTGLAAAADSSRCEWIVAKAICDWADGKKSKAHQAFAAAAAVSFVEHVLKAPSAFEALDRD